MILVKRDMYSLLILYMYVCVCIFCAATAAHTTHGFVSYMYVYIVCASHLIFYNDK